MDKAQFVRDLREHATTVKGWLDDLLSDIGSREKKLADLPLKRNNLIQILVNTLLPGLDDGALRCLEERLPGVLSAKDVSEIRDQETVAIQARYNSNFDPIRYDSNRRDLMSKGEIARNKLTKVSSGITKIAGLQDLIERGYGTKQYKTILFQVQYYTDWKRADEIVDELHARSWGDVRSSSSAAMAEIESAKDALFDAEKLILDLDGAMKKYSEAQKEMANIETVVLEKARIRVRAAFDTLTEIPSWMSDIGNVDKEILKQSAELIKLRAERQPFSDELKQLQKLCLEAEKSGAKTVPDKYAQMLKKQRANCQGPHYYRTSGGSSNNWMLTYLFYDNLFSHLGGGSHHHGGDRAIGRDAVRNTADEAPQAVEQNRRYGS